MEEALFPEDLKDNYSVVYLQLIATAYEKGQKFFGPQGLNDERKRAKEFQEKALTLKYQVEAKFENNEIVPEDVFDFY